MQEARERSPALDATLETIELDSHIGGGILAGALSYRLFVFLLPLAFFLVSGLGVPGLQGGGGALSRWGRGRYRVEFAPCPTPLPVSSWTQH